MGLGVDEVSETANEEVHRSTVRKTRVRTHNLFYSMYSLKQRIKISTEKKKKNRLRKTFMVSTERSKKLKDRKVLGPVTTQDIPSYHYNKGR